MNAVVTLLTSIDFLPSAKVLAHSIRRGHHRLQAALLLVIVPDLADHTAIYHLGYDEVVIVDPIPNPNDSHVSAWIRCGFTKLRIWQLHDLGYDRLFYIDADCAVVDRDLDLDAEFRRLDHVDFAAAPDFFPPDRFNAGVMLIQSGSETFSRLLRSACDVVSYDGGDTGYLNVMFPDWYTQADANARLPFALNAQRAMRSFTRRAPAYWRTVPVRILHYSSQPKPWERRLAPPESFEFGVHDDPDEIFAKLLAEADLQQYAVSRARSRTVGIRDGARPIGSASLPRQFTSPVNLRFGRYGNEDRIWLQKIASAYDMLMGDERHSNPPFITPFIHQIWLGDRPIPPQFLQWAETLRRSNPNFGYRLWRDSDVAELDLVRRDLYEQATTPIQRSDILRWELIYRYGGVYADLDVEGVAPLQDLFGSLQMVVGLGNTGHVEIMNSFVAATPQHRVILACLKALRVDDRCDIFETTGAGAITRAIGAMDLGDLVAERVAVVPAHVLYPLPNRMRFLSADADRQLFVDRGETFIIHHWSCSWQTPPTAEVSDRESAESGPGSEIVSMLKQHLSTDGLDPVWSTINQFLK